MYPDPELPSGLSHSAMTPPLLVACVSSDTQRSSRLGDNAECEPAIGFTLRDPEYSFQKLSVFLLQRSFGRGYKKHLQTVVFRTY